MRVVLCLIGATHAVCMCATPKPTPKTSAASAAFTSWHEDHAAREAIKRQVNRMSHPDVPVRLVFEGVAHQAVLPGDATTETLNNLACKVHNLAAGQNFRFVHDGRPLAPKLAISESPLANTRNLEVLIMPAHGLSIKRGASTAEPGGSWWASAGSGAGQRRTSIARKADAKRAERNMITQATAQTVDVNALQASISQAEEAGANERTVARAKAELVHAKAKAALEAAFAGDDIGTLYKKHGESGLRTVLHIRSAVLQSAHAEQIA